MIHLTIFLNYANADMGQAIFSYQGAVFRETKADTLNTEELNYVNNNLVILSAHYGALKHLI